MAFGPSYYPGYPYMGNYPQVSNPPMPNYPNTGNGAVPDLMGQYKAPYQVQPVATVPQPAVPAPQPQQMPTGSDIVWVQGEAGAKSYPVAPNTRLMLMDSEADVFYIKSADNSGMPLPLRTFDYVERTAENPREKPQEHVCKCGEKYVKKDDFDVLAAELEEMRRRIDELTTAK